MNKLFKAFLLSFFLFNQACGISTDSKEKIQVDPPVLQTSTPKPAAENLSSYLKLLKGKKIALVVNQTSTVGKTHLADTLLASGIQIIKIFSPEHGFRGKADAGEHVNNETDSKTGLPVISLYGRNKKPDREQLKDVDIIVFDIQDVGVRFYTYISTLHYVMEAAAENNKEVLILDRPNPNGFYIDGPVLDTSCASFVGMHPIPIVHGLTVGELAGMINGEKWLTGGKNCKLTVIKATSYTHKSHYSLPVKPSPNLPNDLSIRLYPSLCLFEGTNISVGRGTLFPFQAIGFPDTAFGRFTFTPKSIEGMAKNPPCENKLCYGVDFREKEPVNFTLKYLIDFYRLYPDKKHYFNNFFEKLAGNKELRKQIEQGMTEAQIRKTWEKDLDNYRTMRKKYLLYE